jgi:biopolymer transport protein ExbD
MAASSGGDEEEITAINVTPLVDVMLVLLVIFMVTASYIVQQSIKITLPDAETGQTTIERRSLTFTLDKEARLFLDGVPITYEDLGPLVEKISSDVKKSGGDSSIQALISADTSVSHGKVIHLIDAVRKIGITDFAVNVETTSLAK